jgi:hypothetical protein
MTTWRLRIARGLALVITAVLPLVAWPGQERPFSTPKLWLLSGAALLVLALAWRPWTAAPPRRRLEAWLAVLPLVWLASLVVPSLFGEVVSFAALATATAGGLWAIALLAARPRPRDLAIAAIVAGSGVAAIALLQWVGLDPFVAAGWHPRIEGASVRMRVYATLGNPNFVAAFLSGTVPLTASIIALAADRRARICAGVLLTLQVLAVVATGSRAGVLGLLTAALVWAAAGGRGRAAVVVTALVVAVGAMLHSQGRDLRDTLDGRIYVWTVVGQGASAHPVVGYGPGGVEAFYRQWERSLRTQRIPSVRSPYAGPQQHAHNDYLEALVERGIPGLLALVFVIAAPVVLSVGHALGRRIDPLIPGAAGSIAAYAAVAMVDFPLTRPDDLLGFWTAVAIAAMTNGDGNGKREEGHGRSINV